MVVGFEKVKNTGDRNVTKLLSFVFFCHLYMLVFPCNSNKTNPELPGDCSIIETELFTYQQFSVLKALMNKFCCLSI